MLSIWEGVIMDLVCQCRLVQQKYTNPPTPPGSTGCESASGFPPCSPHHRIQVVLGSPRGSPPCKMPGLCSSGLGFAFVCPKEIKRPLRDDFLTRNTILSAQKAPAGRFSSPKYNFICPKRPCGTTFCYSQSEIDDIGTEILYKNCFVNNSTQKASLEDLQVRNFANFKFVKIRTCSSSVDSEFNTKKQPLPEKYMRP